MSFLTGKTKQVSGGTPRSDQAYADIQDFISRMGLSTIFPDYSAVTIDTKPYQDLFTMQNARNFAQAKESAGNLTGSGYGNFLGRAASDASVQQGALLADLFNQRRQQVESLGQSDANRFLGLILGAMRSPSATQQMYYQPGLLDYGAQAFAGLASGGAFGQGGIFGGKSSTE